MNNYLAKSDGETIIEHTLELLQNLKKLQQLYPTIHVDWKLLEIACLYHDLGKMNAKFQEKVKKNRSTINGEVPHGLLSASLLPEDRLEENYPVSDIQALAYAVAYHHERDFSKITDEQYEDEVEALEDEVVEFPFHLLKLEKYVPEELREEYFELGARLTAAYDAEAYPKYVMLKGLLNRIDHAASAHEQVEYPNDFLEESMAKLGYTWNPLQEYMLKHQEENVVVIAQTGMGKTEAGLLWLGNNKGFFTLPLRAAINAIYDRVYKGIVNEEQTKRIGLLHAETFNQYLSLDEEELEIGIGEYENRTKQWALPLTICTMDQVFDFVYRYGGYEQKLATLSYSKVIIDEIQMYSADLLAYLIKGLKYITDYGGKFAILTATLPPFIVDLLKENDIVFELPEKPFIDEKLPLRHSIEVIHDEITVNPILSKYSQNRVLVICNTIKRAKEIYQQLQEELSSEEVHLLHSQFIKQDRRNKEEQIFKFGQVPDKAEKKAGIWVATQVVEASLDIDFDILLTELTDLNGLFQRMGRCYRKRSLDNSGTNVFVFDEKCSGVGFVVDKKLHELSKEALSDAYGPLSEEQKMQRIKETYTTERVASSEYYTNTKNYIKYLDVLYEGEKSKLKVRKIFRNIHNTSVIPQSVYKENQEKIDNLVALLQQKNKKETTKKEREHLKAAKKKAWAKLSAFKVDLPDYVLEWKMFAAPLEVSRYESIPILKCKYDKEIGVTLIKPEKEDCFF
ncbi:CRISPR-associated helicase Cas3' [Enterococcus sp. BWT-B8]|uniref:CRISPR-associated helicase Cas3' n=1 Tax=Enterococcus sp. BWT-B8 TaxID=2885157 RepID=UPI001E51BFBA|nr:CRISPR-associated helicase Cas3' [Enterococcus sp. BWT-B8]MCB5951159.1 CRISPR-associated helicase Cas3' [Enterococcus sp. BWT-B8]